MFPDVPTFKDKGYDVLPLRPRRADGLCGRARQPARRCQDQADHGVQRGDPGSALQGIFQEERVPGRRPHRRRPDQGSRQRRQRRSARSRRRSSRTRKNNRAARRPAPSHNKTKATRLPIKKITCHVVAAPVARPFTSSRGWLYKTRGTVPRRDRDRRRHRRLGRMLRPVGRRQGLHRHPVRAARDRPRSVRRRGDLGGPLQPHQGLRPEGHVDLRPSAASTSRCGTSWAGPCNKPVHKLIGGAYPHRGRSPTPPASTSSTWTGWSRRRSRRRWHVQEDGFRAIKMKIGLGRPQARFRARRGGARGDRPRRQADGRCQPLLHGARRDQARPQAGRTRHRVVRGADLARRTSTAMSR